MKPIANFTVSYPCNGMTYAGGYPEPYDFGGACELQRYVYDISGETEYHLLACVKRELKESEIPETVEKAKEFSNIDFVLVDTIEQYETMVNTFVKDCVDRLKQQDLERINSFYTQFE